MSSSRARDAGNESKHVHRSGRSRHSSRSHDHGHRSRSHHSPVPITVVPPTVQEVETPDTTVHADTDAPSPSAVPEASADEAVEQGEAGESKGWVHLLVPFIGHGASTLIVGLMSGAISTLIISDATNHSLDLDDMMRIFLSRTLGTMTGATALTAVAMMAFGRERVFELSGRLVNGMASGLLISGAVAIGLGIYTWRQMVASRGRPRGIAGGHGRQGRRVHWIDEDGVEHRGVEHENGDVEEVDIDDTPLTNETPLLGQTSMNADAVADRWRAAANGQEEVVYEYDDDEGQHWRPLGNHATTFQYEDPRLSQLKKQHRQTGQQGGVHYPQQHGAQDGVAGKVVDPRDSLVSAAGTVQTTFAMDDIDGVEQVDAEVDVVEGEGRVGATAGRGKQDRLDKVEVTSVADGDSVVDDPASSGVLPHLPVGAEEAVPDIRVVIPGVAPSKRDSDTIAREIEEAKRFDAYRKSIPATQRGTYMSPWHSRTALPAGVASTSLSYDSDTGSSLQQPPSGDSGQVALPHKDAGVEGGDKVKAADVLVGTTPAPAQDTGRGGAGKEEGKGAAAVGNDHGPEVAAAQEAERSKAAVAQPQLLGHGAGHGSNGKAAQVPGFINPATGPAGPVVGSTAPAIGPAMGRGPLPSMPAFKFGGPWPGDKGAGGGSEDSKGGLHGKGALKVPVIFTPGALSAASSSTKPSPLNQAIGSEVGKANSASGQDRTAQFPGADRSDPRDATFNGVLDHMWGAMEESRQEIEEARRRRGEGGQGSGVEPDAPADEEGQGRQESYSKEDFRRSRVYDANQGAV